MKLWRGRFSRICYSADVVNGVTGDERKLFSMNWLQCGHLCLILSYKIYIKIIWRKAIIYMDLEDKLWQMVKASLHIFLTSSTAQGGGWSFKNRKPIGEVCYCESGMAGRSHWWTERCLISLTLSLFFSLFLYLSLIIYLSKTTDLYLSTYLSVCLSISLSIYLPIYLSTYLSTYLSI